MEMKKYFNTKYSNKCHKSISATVIVLTGQVALTVIVFLTALPESSVKVSESKLVFTRLPDIVHSIGQLPLSDLGQLFSPGRGQCSVVRVLGGTLCMAAGMKENKNMSFPFHFRD